MDQELFARFRKCAVDVLSVSEDQVVPEAHFADDLDADSLDLVELVMALEEEFDVEVPEERKKLKLGICGEHGGDPDSVGFCHEIGLDYVSCSPFRVPIARLAAAQAALA